MDNTDLNSNWEEQKGKLKKKIIALTDNELLFEDSKKEEIIERLQLQLGKTKEELNQIIGGL
jgi:uncharacterized protein YjbJ (UPF0337 family)